MANLRELGSTAGSPASDQAIASTAIDAAKQVGGEFLAAACDGATALADEQRGYLADEIAAVGTALHRAAEALDDGGLPLRRYAGDAAGRVDDFARTVRTRSWSQLAADVEDLARGWPFAFAASALGIGFLAGRFLLSPPPAPERPAGQPSDALAQRNAVNVPSTHIFAEAAAPRDPFREES